MVDFIKFITPITLFLIISVTYTCLIRHKLYKYYIKYINNQIIYLLLLIYLSKQDRSIIATKIK